MRTSITLYEPQSLRDAFTYFWQKLNSAYDNNSSFEGTSQKAVNGDGKDSLYYPHSLQQERLNIFFAHSGAWCLYTSRMPFSTL